MATGAGRTLSVSGADKVKEHHCRLAAARTVVLLLSSLVFFQLHGPRCGNACPQTSWCLKCAPAQSSWSARWSMPSALRQQKQQPSEGNIAGSWPPPTIRSNWPWRRDKAFKHEIARGSNDDAGTRKPFHLQLNTAPHSRQSHGVHCFHKRTWSSSIP
ncbi:hypothetical protein TcCL_ESM05865 [Trypanosoma cruzi]|nr:hypothetical protein TcCL_ESM05865 [Trypanosoma cruzi]